VASLPGAVSADGATIGEGLEARLVSVTGTVEAKPARSTSGDVTVSLSTAGGSVRVAMDASSNISAASIAAGDRIRVTGVVGQRASRKGAADGYRVWARDPADIVRVSGGGATPGPSGSATPSATSGSVATVGSIAAAILRSSGTVAVVGVVTIKPSLLDSTARRIVIEDGTAAVEVLLPANASSPRVGRRARVDGEIGRAYGAPRIRATSISTTGSEAISPLELRAGPTAAHEWRLVRVRGDVLDVHRAGDRWDAELLVGGVRVPILGLAGAAIPSSALVGGRTATITGIVRRPYPTATDRRFAIVPRSSADLVSGSAADDRTAGPGTTGSGTTGSDPSGSNAASSGGKPVAGLDDAGNIDLVALGDHIGEVVRVGGLVASIVGDGFDLDDGTSVERIVVRGDAAGILATIEVCDALTVEGRAERGPDGSAVIAVDDPARIGLVGAPTAPTGIPGGSPEERAPSSPVGPTRASLVDSPLPPVGAAGIALIAAASLAVTLVRRRRVRERFAARVAARLDELVGSAGGRSPGGAAFGAPGVVGGPFTAPIAASVSAAAVAGGAARGDPGSDGRPPTTPGAGA